MVTASETAMKESVGKGVTDSITGCPAMYSTSMAAPAGIVSPLHYLVRNQQSRKKAAAVNLD